MLLPYRHAINAITYIHAIACYMPLLILHIHAIAVFHYCTYMPWILEPYYILLNIQYCLRCLAIFPLAGSPHTLAIELHDIYIVITYHAIIMPYFHAMPCYYIRHYYMPSLLLLSFFFSFLLHCHHYQHITHIAIVNNIHMPYFSLAAICHTYYYTYVMPCLLHIIKLATVCHITYFHIIHNIHIHTTYMPYMLLLLATRAFSCHICLHIYIHAFIT